MVVVIDSGANPAHPYLKGMDIQGISLRWDEEGALIVSGDYTDRLGHGTAMSGVVASHCHEARLFELRLFDSMEEPVEENQLLVTLRYVEEHIPCDILNLSLGLCVCEQKEALREQCARLRDRGTVVVSAFDNAGAMTYPAAFPEAVGVTAGEDCLKSTDVKTMEGSPVDFCAFGRAQRVAWVNPDMFFDSGNSLACAHVSGMLARLMMDRGTTAAAACETLRRESSSAYQQPMDRIPSPPPPVSAYRKAVVFPFNKEIHSLLRFSALLPFVITGVYDLRFSARIGAHTNRLLQRPGEDGDMVIQDVDRMDWDSFDTLIVGHTGELCLLMKNTAWLKALLDTAAEKGKYVFAFDDLGQQWRGAYEGNPRFYYPKTRLSDLRPPCFGKLYRSYRPVAAVFGTSSQQGKFTLQLTLRDKLIKRGYRIGQIGTEPSSYLFGMEGCFHFGLDSTCEISRFETIAYLNQVIEELSDQGAELILTGCQSEILPHDTGNLAYFPLHQMEFLLGVQPDLVVLCVNPFDPEEYVRRCIAYIEAAAECCVAALVVFPMTFRRAEAGLAGGKRPLTEEEYRELRIQWERTFERPVFRLDEEEHMEALTDTIIDYFAEGEMD